MDVSAAVRAATAGAGSQSSSSSRVSFLRGLRKEPSTLVPAAVPATSSGTHVRSAYLQSLSPKAAAQPSRKRSFSFAALKAMTASKSLGTILICSFPRFYTGLGLGTRFSRKYGGHDSVSGI